LQDKLYLLVLPYSIFCILFPVPDLRMRGTVTLFPLYAFMVWTGKTLPFPTHYASFINIHVSRYMFYQMPAPSLEVARWEVRRWLQTFRDSLSVPFPRVFLDLLTLEDGTEGCHENISTCCLPMLRNIPEERRPHQRRSGRLKSRRFGHEACVLLLKGV
jgi:hypothetical protein